MTHLFRLSVLLLAPVLHAASNELLVAAASDLAPIQSQLGTAFQKQVGGGMVIRWSTGASGTLAQQIANGSPHDVFLSANRQYVEDLANAGRIDPASVTLYATGRLGLWSAGGRIRKLEDLRDATIARTIAIPNPRFAPYGVAARQALEAAGLWQQVSSRIVYAENVRQSMQYAESGNADAVITSWTLLHHRDSATLITDTLHQPIAQAAGIRSDTPNRIAAQRFLHFLQSETARNIFTAHGLTVAEPQKQTQTTPPPPAKRTKRRRD